VASRVIRIHLPRHMPDLSAEALASALEQGLGSRYGVDARGGGVVVASSAWVGVHVAIRQVPDERTTFLSIRQVVPLARFLP
jgi:hypothetical protein